MHDIKAIRDDKAGWVAALSRRPAYAEIAEELADDILKKDRELRDLLVALQTAQARRNEASKLIGKAKAQKDEAQASALMVEVAGLKDEIQKGEERERAMKAKIDEILAGIPNLPQPDAPDGGGEADNVPVPARAFGATPGLNNAIEQFALGEALGMMDFERAAKVSGSRFVYLTRGLARLERALGSFMLDLHTDTFGYTEMQTPILARDDAFFGTTQLPKFENDQFWAISGEVLVDETGDLKEAIRKNRYGLIPTA
jgi:seryl-tRNA synthetase